MQIERRKFVGRFRYSAGLWVDPATGAEAQIEKVGTFQCYEVAGQPGIFDVYLDSAAPTPPSRLDMN